MPQHPARHHAPTHPLHALADPQIEGEIAGDAHRLANLQEVLAFAKYPNVPIKATSAPNYSDQPYAFRDIHDQLRQLYDAFGPAP